MSFLAQGPGGQVNLQASLSAASAGSASAAIVPHHPITCTGQLVYDEAGRFSCEHAMTEPGEERTLHCLNHTIALLIIELGSLC